MPEMNLVEWGLTGVLLMIVWRLLGIVSAQYMSKRNITPATPTITALACQVDPQHYQHIKEIHQYTQSVARMIDQGAFACQWKDRDEIRDLLDAMKEQTREMRVLASELRKSRNGYDGG